MTAKQKSNTDGTTVTVTLGLILSLSVFSMDVNLPVFSIIAADLGAPPAEAQLIVSYFLLGYAGAQIPVGILSDRYGRLPLLYFGGISFFSASIFSALANDFDSLLLGRFVQGVSAAAGAVVCRAIARDITEGKRLSQLMAILVSFLSVVSFLAPLIGSFLIIYWSWRSTFWVTAGFSLMVILLIKMFLAETHAPEQSSQSAFRQLINSLKIFFSSWQCIWGTLLVAIPFSGYMVIISSSSTILIEIYNIDAIWVGLIFGIGILSYLTGATLTRYLVVHWGMWRMLKISISIFVLSSILLASLSAFDVVPLALLWFVFSVYLFALGIIFPTGTAIVMQGVAKTAGFGASLLGTIQMGIAAFATWLASVLYTHSTLSITLLLTATGGISVLVYLVGIRPVRRQSGQPA